MTQFGNNSIKESQKNPSGTLDNEVLAKTPTQSPDKSTYSLY